MPWLASGVSISVDAGGGGLQALFVHLDSTRDLVRQYAPFSPAVGFSAARSVPLTGNPRLDVGTTESGIPRWIQARECC